MAIERWHVVRDRKLIVSGPDGILREDAETYAVKWNMLNGEPIYEAISDEEARRRHARQVRWEDVG